MSHILTNKEIEKLVEEEFLSADDVEKLCEEEANRYDGMYDRNILSVNNQSSIGFFLSQQLATDFLTKNSQKLSAKEKQKRMAELRDIYNDPNSSRAAKDEAVYKAMCYLYAFVYALVRRYCSGYMGTMLDQEDYIMIGLTAVARNLCNYDEGMAITSFFYLHIKHDIIESIAESQSVSRYYNEQLTKVKKAYRELEVSGKTPEIADIIYMLPDVSVPAIKVCYQLIISAPIDLAEADCYQGHTPTPEEEFEKKETETMVREAIKKALSEEERKVLVLLYGIGEEREHTRPEIARILKLPVAVIRKLQCSGEQKLRKVLQNNGLEDTGERTKLKRDKDRISSMLSFVPLFSNDDLLNEDFSK